MEEQLSRTAVEFIDDEQRHPHDRRDDERHMTLFRVASLLAGDRRSLCVVKNISGGGAMIRAFDELAEGQSVRLELKEQQPIEAVVTWLNGADTGIEFHTRIDVLSLLKVESDAPRPRMPRVEVRTNGFVRQGALLHRLAVENISQGGISARCDADLAVGGEVTVTLPGVVRWGSSSAYGITFNAVLGLPVLVEWLRSQASTLSV